MEKIAISSTKIRGFSTMRTKQKGLNIDLTSGQYQMLHNLMCDAYDRGYDQRPRIDTQTFDNLFDAICNAKQTYL